jgi:hypothetical protein
MLALTKLERFASRKPHQLSGGQRQRVALARALAKAQAAAARRAARRARQEAARGDPVRADGHPGKPRHHLRDRHPRPGRGDDGRHPRRGDGEGRLDFENFVFLAEDDLYWKAYLSSAADRGDLDRC